MLVLKVRRQPIAVLTMVQHLHLQLQRQYPVEEKQWSWQRNGCVRVEVFVVPTANAVTVIAAVFVEAGHGYDVTNWLGGIG